MDSKMREAFEKAVGKAPYIWWNEELQQYDPVDENSDSQTAEAERQQSKWIGYQAALSQEREAELANRIHYPQCWDVVAYPTLQSALIEIADCSECNSRPQPATIPDGTLTDYGTMMTALICAYTDGYGMGHHDTVEGQYTDVHCSDRETYFKETLEDWASEHPEYFTSAAPSPAEEE